MSDSLRGWPSCDLRYGDANREIDGLWWPASYAGWRLSEHSREGRDLRRQDVCYHLALLVDADPEIVDDLHRRMYAQAVALDH